MTKNELKALINKKVQRQGTQGAISLAPILNEIIDLIPESTGEGGSGVPVVEIELPKIDNPDEPAMFKIPAEKAEFLKKNPFVIISAKNDRNADVYFMPYETGLWRRIVYDESSYDEITPNIEEIEIYEDDAIYIVFIKSTFVVSSIKNQRPVDRWLRSYIPSEEAVYNEINKTK